jgi:hypothetical protein
LREVFFGIEHVEDAVGSPARAHTEGVPIEALTETARE